MITRWLRTIAAGLMLALFVPVGAAAPADQKQSFGVEDYFRLHRFEEVALSGDGAWVVYSVASQSLDQNRQVQRVHVQRVNSGTATTPPELEGAWALAWIPGTHKLAFLSARSSSVQVHSLDLDSGEARQLTQSGEPVISFRFAPDGSRFAYASASRAAAQASLYDRFRTEESGILVNPDTLSSHDFLNPEWSSSPAAPNVTLWLADNRARASRVPLPGELDPERDSYAWSPDGSALSVRFVAKDARASALEGDRTSLGIVDLRSGRSHVVAKASGASGSHPAVSYSGGQWLGKRRILLLRTVQRDPWVSDSFPDWAIVDPMRPIPQQIPWRSVELYPGGLRFFPTASGGLLVENTLRARHSLFALTAEGLQASHFAYDMPGSSRLFSFSSDGRTAAFVNESLVRPPEIFIRSAGRAPLQLTRLNEPIARRIGFTSREVSWQGSDGITLHGWLLEPKKASGKRLPMITHVHGGPAFPYPDAFAAYFSYWPHPLEVYPSRGIAVFLPNYRGTQSFGRQVASATGDEAAITDIVRGVEALVSAGAADPARLGISGHSHGALIGPMAMARSKLFCASSFAEGVSNQVVMYELMSGDANRYIHDTTIGVSFYESPETYIAASADLQLKGVKTASLFEAGARTSAIFMLGLAKAAKRFGLPSEFVIYPQTAHNIAIPRLQLEAAKRNLEWFDFWLNGRSSGNLQIRAGDGLQSQRGC